jgi:hypothetical protein
MGKVSYTVEQILAQLDQCATDFVFPMLDNGYVYPADVRLHAYRDASRWALTIEALGYSPRAGMPDVSIYRFGNCLNTPPGLDNEDIFQHFAYPEDGPEIGDETVPAEVMRVLIRGQAVAVPRDPAVYAGKGIELQDAPEIRLVELLRVLLPEHRRELLATEEELRRGLPAGLPLILTLDEWRHPDLVQEERPSQTEAFRLLAEVLVTGDPNRYKPTEEPNTHWSNWPEGGTL